MSACKPIDKNKCETLGLKEKEMTFATHLERQFMQRLCEGLAGPTRALYLRARASCKRCYKKAGSKQQNQAQKM
jgi:hypothetical protein